MDVTQIFDSIGKLFGLVSSAPTPGILSVIGLLLLVATGVLAQQAIKRKPEETSKWLGVALFSSLIAGIAFSAAGPSIALLRVSESPIAKISIDKAFDNLETNERVTWVLRLIPFNSTDEKQKNELAIDRLKTLGRPEQRFTFVAPYEDLIGFRVNEAVASMGGNYYDGYHVSGVIFPVEDRRLYPANARGLLQVVQDIESSELKIDNPLIRGKNLLNEDEVRDLSDFNIASWRFRSYSSKYRHYCELAHRFRCDRAYSAHDYIGGLSFDWHPLGLALREVDSDPCYLPASSFCEVTDWKAAKEKLLPKFGSRAFFIKNIEIDKIGNRILIDFADPKSQFIPDIGLRLGKIGGR